MKTISTWIVVVATCVIAWCAFENHRLANETKTANEKYIQKMNETLKELVRSNYVIESDRNRRESQKELEAARQKGAEKLLQMGR